MPEIYLYAELLIHIRQLTLHASLETEKNEHTKILLSFDKKIITALHEGESASIYLPTQIAGTANITFPLKKRTELSTKLQIEDLHQLEQALEASSGVEVPWTASGLGSDASIYCKSCSSQIIKAHSVTEWKDLPSENWAELMDLWFCHKPHEGHHDESGPAESKGFSARSKLGVVPGVGFIDVVSFLVHPDNCSGIKVRTASPSFLVNPWRQERSLPFSSREAIGQDSGTLAEYSISYPSLSQCQPRLNDGWLAICWVHCLAISPLQLQDS
jgi:ubiquitin-protein ligase E3 D